MSAMTRRSSVPRATTMSPRSRRFMPTTCCTGSPRSRRCRPTLDEIARRRGEILGPRPALSGRRAIAGGSLGYCYAACTGRARPIDSRSRTRSISMRAEVGRGIGRALLSELIDRCTAARLSADGRGHRRQRYDGLRSGCTRRWASRKSGYCPRSASSSARWVDIVLMQRALGRGRWHTARLRNRR